MGDLPQSVAWYRDVLGFTIEREHDRGGRVFAVSLHAGNVRILLTQDDGARGTDRAKGEGFSLRVTTTQDIDSLAVEAKRSGAVLDTEPADAWGVRAFRLRDPDGFRLVISSPREA
ncbi:MAG TPA: VOC family protein [Gemmatimonadaceae bacterium]|nr:VOC family protein [Gemmatimonadaceae bacterium]